MSLKIRSRCDECGWIGGPYGSRRVADYAHSRHSCDLTRSRREAYERGIARDAAIDRTPRPCEHPHANHQHGTYVAYTLDRCRCLPCSAACSEYTASLRRRAAYGIESHVDAEPVRQHVATLRASGVGIKTISAQTGISTGTLCKLVYGIRRADGTMRPPSSRILKGTAERLLAVTPQMAADGARVPAVGARRRVEALMTLGWSRPQIAERADVDVQSIRRLDEAVVIEARTARAIAAVYERLWSTLPSERNRYEASAVARTRNAAARAGYASPLAWDDIDNPAATPDLGAPEHGLDLDEWMHLVHGGATPESASARCGTAVQYVKGRAREQGRGDVLRAIAQHILASSSHGQAVDHAESLLAEARAA